MDIHKEARLKEIQNAFSEVFPFLRITFYADAHEEKEGSPRTNEIDPEARVGDVRSGGADGPMTLDSEMQINAFESMMKNEFGLNVQVFRKSGNLWLQTITTDSWTLDRANSKGKHSSELYREKYSD